MINILFEDKDIIVCVKPAGIISQADALGRESMVSLLEAHTKGTIYPIHRLDKETGGVMVYAKSKKASAKLSADIANRRFRKEYLALIHGVPESEGTLCDLLFRDSKKNKSYVVKRKRQGVKEAVLDYKLMKTFKKEENSYSLILVKLQTGRTHQIRVQFSSRGMSLAGDGKYGAKDDFKNLGLWSYKLEFTHPATDKDMSFCCNPDNYLLSYI